jgi:thymidine kinase
VSKLYFRYGAMNSGKSTSLLQAAHNYEERGQHIILAKPAVDLKGEDYIVSRLGVNRRVDLLVSPEHNLREVFGKIAANSARNGSPIACLLIDEAQFLTPEQVEQALEIAVLDDIPVLAYGIRTDFMTIGFPGSIRLMELAHSIEELKTICRCGRKAMFNARKLNDRFVFQGSQVALDGIAASYESLCATCYFAEKERDASN